MLKRLSLLLLIIALSGRTAGADERLSLPVKIDGQPARFALDTGAERTCLFSSGARRLGLPVTPPPADAKLDPGSVVAGATPECTLQLWHLTTKVRLPVVALPGYLQPEIDGVLGWDFVRQNVVDIDGPRRELDVSGTIQTDVSQWTAWTVRPDARQLVARIPAAPGEPNAILIDTGDPSGVQLNPRRWQQWRNAHTERPTSLIASYTPGIGLIVGEECWAKELPLGGVTLAEVPVRSGRDVGGVILGDEYVATLGLFALRRLHLVTDGEQGKVYVKGGPPAAGPNRYEYNRLGAVFVPADMSSNDLIAHVIEGGPAYQAGVRNGDILLAINDLDVTAWRTDPRVLPLSRFWSRPAGTQLQLSLCHEGKAVAAVPTLQNIFPE